MTFNFFSLDYIYYPISGIMWVWHKVFGAVPRAEQRLVLGAVRRLPDLHAARHPVQAVHEADGLAAEDAGDPAEMKKIREKYKDDKQRLSEEMMKLNKEAGVNPLASCLPALIQAPVFIGLFHVLRMFQPVKTPEGPSVWFYRAERLLLRLTTDVQSLGRTPSCPAALRSSAS